MVRPQPGPQINPPRVLIRGVPWVTCSIGQIYFVAECRLAKAVQVDPPAGITRCGL